MTDRRGFTLIEMVVALAVFSLAAMALINLTTESARSAARVDERVLGDLLADNLAVEAVTSLDPPAFGETGGERTLAGRTWRWTRAVAGTADPDVLQVHVRVFSGVEQTGEVIAFRRRP